MYKTYAPREQRAFGAFICHAGQVGMKWGYKKGSENGKRKASDTVRYDSNGNRYKELNDGRVVYLNSSKKNQIPKNSTTKPRQIVRTSKVVMKLQSVAKIKLLNLSKKSIDVGMNKIHSSQKQRK